MWNVRSALLSVVALGLSAQEGQGFSWVALQGGAIAFDPASNVKTAPWVGGQGGTLLGARRYGFSMEFQQSRPESSLTPGLKLTHRAASGSFLNGLSTDSGSAWWPYVGVGLGALTYPRLDPVTHLQESRTAAAAHLSLGFLHRSGALIWGAEARARVAFTKQDMSETQGGLFAGFAWGGGPRRSAAPASVPPPIEAPTPIAPPPPPKAVEAVVPTPTPVPQPAPAPAAQPAIIPIPVPTATTPAPPPPAPVAVPTPAPPVIVPALSPKAVPTLPPASPSAPPSERGARLAALRQMDMVQSLELGRAYIRTLGADRWTLRLEIANLPSTLKAAVEAYGAGTPDLFIAPIKLRTGKTAYQLFLATYATKAEAEAAGRAVPAFFKEGGKPLPMRVGEIPSSAK